MNKQKGVHASFLGALKGQLGIHASDVETLPKRDDQVPNPRPNLHQAYAPNFPVRAGVL